jgi:hypothetical protein
MKMEEFHGPHVEPVQEGHVPIDWSAPTPRCASIRVRSHTCECVPTVYELCTAGGLAHIRRTVKSAGGDRVTESPWVRVAEAKRLWESLLEGHMR